METAATAPYALLDVEDLDDADLDGVLADELLGAVASAGALAEQLEEAKGSTSELTELVGRMGRGALSAHALRAHVLLLAVF